jgi:hypothetical protein
MTTDSKKSLGKAIDELISALEGLEMPARLTAIKAACEHLGIQFGTTPSNQPQTRVVGEDSSFSTPHVDSGIKTTPASPSFDQTTQLDIRTFKDQKSPSSAIERACLVAYYLQRLAPEEERKIEITSNDIEKYFIQAGFPLPRRIHDLLSDAKAAGYFDSVSRGSYRLNAVGHNLVVHSLPRTGVTGQKGNRLTSPRARTLKKANKQRVIHKKVSKSAKQKQKAKKA